MKVIREMTNPHEARTKIPDTDQKSAKILFFYRFFKSTFAYLVDPPLRKEQTALARTLVGEIDGSRIMKMLKSF